jgi:hypothetical protein
MTSRSNIFGLSNANGYRNRVFKIFQKSPDVQRLQKIVLHLPILKSGKFKAKGTKNLTQQRGNSSFKKREHAAPPFQKTLSSTAESKVFRYIR